MKFLTAFILTFLLLGCSFSDKDFEFLKKENQAISHFNEIFPNSESRVSYFRGVGGPQIWCSKTVVYDRYEFAIFVDVKNESFKRPQTIGDARIIIEEYAIDERFKMSSEDDGLCRESFASINQSDFMNLKSVDEIFKFLEVVPIKNQPIKDHEKISVGWERF